MTEEDKAWGVCQIWRGKRSLGGSRAPEKGRRGLGKSVWVQDN